ncbi:dynamin family protein [Kocuria sp. p3-SID1433]|uniref:dynamin family protein n=1 Tax=unclassified Kocuria TaxID=2649579 RepID=UPI0021A57939|nr:MULTISPECIES: dynamin family protein [unclassified Kocuria]MCT1601104.1 dynamin family protein [Kocuria sp. p3-SID1428]MCT2179674.1 dynamin family protein [Kocuria sp. p3-SID1433]
MSTDPDPAANGRTPAEAVDELRSVLSQVSLLLDTPEAQPGRESARRSLDQIDDYVLPRVRHLDAPLLAVVGGSTGAGKSTIVNALIGRPVTRAGVVRPTTRQPMLIHHPDDAAVFEGTRVLPHLARVRGRLAGVEGTGGEFGAPETAAAGTSLVLLADDGADRGIALLDAPDIDSVSEANRKLAGQLLAAADLWLFTTTANRYADAAAWDLLVEAGRRRITVAVILDRVPAGAAEEIEPDLRRMLTEKGLGQAPIFVIPESPLNAAQMLPAAAVDPLRIWLSDLAADAQARSEVARRTLGGALGQLAERTDDVAAAAAAQREVADQLRSDVEEAHRRALEAIDEATRDGSLLRDEVLSRWQDYVGTGEFFRSLETTIGRWRDRAGAALRGKPAPEVQVEQALETGLQAVIVEELAKAGEQSQRRWRADAAGRGLLDGDDLGRLPDDVPERSAEVIRSWQSEIMALIQREGAGKRTQARLMSIGLNIVTVGLMVVVFSMSAGLTGAEVGIAGASGVVGTKLLEAVFGEDAVRRMAQQAREDLEHRMEEFVEQLKQPWLQRLETVADPEPARLREAAAAVRTAGEAL